MVEVYTVFNRFQDKNGNIFGYVLKNKRTGVCVQEPSDKVKDAIRNGLIEVDNLTLTSDNRLILKEAKELTFENWFVEHSKEINVDNTALVLVSYKDCLIDLEKNPYVKQIISDCKDFVGLNLKMYYPDLFTTYTSKYRPTSFLVVSQKAQEKMLMQQIKYLLTNSQYGIGFELQGTYDTDNLKNYQHTGSFTDDSWNRYH